MTKLEMLTRDFVAAVRLEVEAQLKQHLLSMVSGNLAGTHRLKAAHSLKALPRRAAKPAPGAKRTPAQLRRLSEELLKVVTDHPGLGIEKIAKLMRTTTKEINLPMKKLVGEHRVRASGQKRATKYKVW